MASDASDEHGSAERLERSESKWEARWASQMQIRPAPSWVERLTEIPIRGQALDVAAGNGRLALWAARRGLAVTAVDIARSGLETCRAAALRESLFLETLRCDLEAEPILPGGGYSLITCFQYEQPSLWPAMLSALAPGGMLLVSTHTVRNLERNAHPSRRFLVEENELLRRAAPLTVLYYREEWEEEEHTARLLARRNG